MRVREASQASPAPCPPDLPEGAEPLKARRRSAAHWEDLSGGASTEQDGRLHFHSPAHTQRKPPGKQGRGSGRHPGRCYLEGGEREEDGKDSGHSKGYMPGRANADGCRDSFRKSVTPDSGAEVADSPAHCHTPLQTRVTTRRERGSGPFQMACL